MVYTSNANAAGGDYVVTVSQVTGMVHAWVERDLDRPEQPAAVAVHRHLYIYFYINIEVLIYLGASKSLER